MLARRLQLPIISRQLRRSHLLPPFRSFFRQYVSKPNPPTAPSRTRRAIEFLTTPHASVDNLMKWFFRAVAASLAGHIFLTYFYTMKTAYGISMLPTIASEGDWLIISKYYRRGRGIQVGDIVGFCIPSEIDGRAVKRVIGMPGDFVLHNTPGKSAAMIQVPEGHCWLVGDNLSYSRDSRIHGPIPLALVTGKVLAKWSPFTLPVWFDNGLQPAVLDDDVD